MLSLRASEVGKTENGFYIKLKPIPGKYVQAALAVSGFTIEDIKKRGIEPTDAMKRFADWLKTTSVQDVSMWDLIKALIGLLSSITLSAFMEPIPSGYQGLTSSRSGLAMKSVNGQKPSKEK